MFYVPDFLLTSTKNQTKKKKKQQSKQNQKHTKHDVYYNIKEGNIVG